MKIPFRVTKTYSLLSAVFMITISIILGPQPLLHQALAQGQANNTGSSNNNNNTATTAAASASNSSSSSSTISIHLSKGYVNGKIAYFIATDASDSQIAASITNNTGFKVNFTPNLASIPESALQPVMFLLTASRQVIHLWDFNWVLLLHCLEKKDTAH